MKIPFSLSHDPWGRLVLVDAEGTHFAGVEPIHAFPMSNPERWVSLCDAEGREIAWIDDLASLNAEVRQTLEEELQRREFVPVIRRIVDVSADLDPSQWEVETDRGRTSFTLNSEEDVRHLGPTRMLIVDVHGVRYLVPDTLTLDAASRRVLDRYL
jgi:hypothetical protein